MYRVSPFTYYVSAVLSTGVANTNVVCNERELLKLVPPGGKSCGEYLADYMKVAGGNLLNPDSTRMCDFCPVKDTNTFLAQVNISYDDRWRNIGILFVYIFINVIGAVGFYWLLRVPKKWSKKSKKE